MVTRDDFHQQIGVVLLEWREGYARAALDVLPRHLNRSGILHGGVLMSVLDEVGALCGLFSADPALRRSSVTVDMDCRFVGQASGGRVVATGEVASQGRSLYFTRTQIVDAGGKVLAYGASTHKWRRSGAAG